METQRNRLLPVSIFIVLLVTLMPGDGKIAGNYLDKVAHFLIFFFLALNICYKYKNNNRLISALFAAIVLGFVTEIIQQFIPGRGMDIYDALADCLGVVLGYYMYIWNSDALRKGLLRLGA